MRAVRNLSFLLAMSTASLVFADDVSREVQMLNNQIQVQLQHMHEQNQKQLKELNDHIQQQLKQLNDSTQKQIKSLESEIQKIGGDAPASQSNAEQSNQPEQQKNSSNGDS